MYMQRRRSQSILPDWRADAQLASLHAYGGSGRPEYRSHLSKDDFEELQGLRRRDAIVEQCRDACSVTRHDRGHAQQRSYRSPHIPQENLDDFSYAVDHRFQRVGISKSQQKTSRYTKAARGRDPIQGSHWNDSSSYHEQRNWGTINVSDDDDVFPGEEERDATVLRYHGRGAVPTSYTTPRSRSVCAPVKAHATSVPRPDFFQAPRTQSVLQQKIQGGWVSDNAAQRVQEIVS
jgi:hypothetical protein